MRPEFHLVFWPAATVLAYVCARLSYRRHARWWTSALVLAPALLLALALAHTGYRGIHGGIALAHRHARSGDRGLRPAAVPAARVDPPLLASADRGVAVGSLIAGVSAWLLGSMLDLPADLRLSLLPRSVATPFAMTVSSHVGGVPDLTAVFVIVTGVAGAAIGQLVRGWLPLRSSLARGALFGMARTAREPRRPASWRPRRARSRAW